MVSAVNAAGVSSATPTEHFDVSEYRVLGNTVLSNRQIEGVLYPRLGKDKTLADVDAARQALEAAYHDLGYATVFVDIPPQEVRDGIVRLHVTEARVRVRTISGARYFSEGRILEQLPAAQPGSVPRLNDLQQQLDALNVQTPDRSVVPILKAGPMPGTTDLAFKVEDHLPLHGSIELDNQNTADSKPLRTTIGLSYDNLFGQLDSASVQYTSAPQRWNQVGVFNANYSLHPFDGGIRPSLSFTNSSSNVATIGTLGVLGDGQVIGGRLNWPVLQLPGDSQSLTLGLDYKHFRNTIDLESTTPTTGGVTIEPISYLNASLSYGGFWQRAGASGAVAQSGSLNISANVGPRGVSNSAVDFSNSRYQGRGNYAYLHLDAAFMTRLPAAMLLTLRAAAQISQDPLVVYEQDSIAGVQNVRGYLEAEVLGDDALRGTLQLQSPPLTRRGYLLGDMFIFFDAGRSHEIDALPGEAADTSLRSVGAGLDLLPGHRIAGSVTWADPLQGGPRTPAHDSRLLFDLKGSF
jgi:hemolysin activation/secretion protein